MDSRVRNIALLYPPQASLTSIREERAVSRKGLRPFLHLRVLIDRFRNELEGLGAALGLRLHIQDIQLHDVEQEITGIIGKERGEGIHDADILATVNPSTRQLGMMMQLPKKNALQRVIVGSTDHDQLAAIDQLGKSNEIPVFNQKNPSSEIWGVVHRIIPLDLLREKIDASVSFQKLERALLYPDVPPDDVTTKKDFSTLSIASGADRKYFVERKADQKDIEERSNYVQAKIREMGLE